MLYPLITFFLVLLSFSAQALSVKDDAGTQVSLEKPAMRIVTLAPHLTEQLFSLGVGERIIATVEYSDYPKAALSIPRIGGAEEISAEVILALQPDLVVAWEEGSPAEVLSLLESLGVMVYRASSKSLRGVSKTLSDLAVLTQRPEVAASLVTAFNEEMDKIALLYRYKGSVSVFYQLWYEPLMTANKQQMINEMIVMCGGRNLFSEQAEVVPQTSIESIVVLNPEVILAPEQGTPTDWKKRWQAWPEISAVSKQHLYTLNADLVNRPTLRSLEGLQQVCDLLDRARSNS